MKSAEQNQEYINMDTIVNHSRGPFFNIEAINDPHENQILPLSKNSFFPLIINMLITIPTICGLIYFNIYFMPGLYNVWVANKPGTMGMVPDNCTYYDCRDSAYSYVHNYATYSMCNQGSCASTLCSNFDCSKPTFRPISYYYNCYSNCTNLIHDNVTPLNNIFIFGCFGSFLFGAAALISLVYGFVVVCYRGSAGLSYEEKFALLVHFLCPSAKYYVFRQRTDWENTRISFKPMLLIDFLTMMLVGSAAGLYLGMAAVELFQFYEYLLLCGMGLMFLSYQCAFFCNFVDLMVFQTKRQRLNNN